MARRSPLEVARERAEIARYRLQATVDTQRRKQLQRAYDAASSTQYRKKRGDQRSGNAVMQQAQTSLRMWARHLDENHDLAVGILDDLTNKIIGCGIMIEPMVLKAGGQPHAAVNTELRRLWSTWTGNFPEATRSLPWSQIEAMACRSWLRDGEVLVQHVTGTGAIRHRTAVPYSIELIEADYLPFGLMRSSTPDQNRIVHGVELTDWREAVGYHLLLEHPGDYGMTVNLGSVIGLQTKRVSADNVTHIRFSRRLGQVRGVPIFHAVLQRLEDLKDYEESERVAARVAAAFTAVITKSTDFFGASNLDETTGNRNLEMNPGMIFDDLLPGEDVKTIDSTRPNEQLEPFRNSQLRAIAAGTGASYSGVSRNYNGTYSAQRQELVESWIGYERAREYFTAMFHGQIWRRFVDMCVAARLVSLAGADASSIYRADFTGPAMPWIDPVKEVEASAAAVSAGFKSRHMVIREAQYDPAVVDEQLKADPLREQLAAAKAPAKPAPKPAAPPQEQAA